MRTLRPLLTLIATTALLTAGVATAHAETTRVDDRRGDVWHRTLDDEGQFDGWEQAPERTLEDVVAVRYEHTGRSLVATTRFVNLRREAFQLVVLTDLRMPEGHTATIRLELSRDEPEPLLFVDGEPVACRGLSGAATWNQHGRASASVPRRCLGNPRWVRGSTVVVGSDPGRQFYQDALGTRLYESVTFTKRLRPGSARG